jgi:hypothetical protein
MFQLLYSFTGGADGGTLRVDPFYTQQRLSINAIARLLNERQIATRTNAVPSTPVDRIGAGRFLPHSRGLEYGFAPLLPLRFAGCRSRIRPALVGTPKGQQPGQPKAENSVPGC